MGKKKDLMHRMWDRKKKRVVELGRSGTRTEAPKGTVREGGEQKEVRRTFKILREV